MAKKEIDLNELIEEGNKYNFDNNKKLSYDEYFSQATPEFLSWVSKVEDYIVTNYDENSGPHKMLNDVSKRYFSGFHQSQFETEFNKLKGAISSCKTVLPNKKAHDHPIIALIKMPLFWTVMVIAIGTTFKLAFDLGNAKFDKEKIELNDQNKANKDSLNLLHIELENAHNTINKLQNKQTTIP